VHHLRGARDRQQHRRPGQQPGQRHLTGARPGRLGHVVHRPARLGQVTGRDREPRDEADALLLGVGQHVLGLPVGQVVEVLHGGDLGDLGGLLQLRDAHLGQPDRTDLALVLQLRQLADLVGQRHLGVDPVQLQQVEPLHLQPPQRQLGLLAQVGRPANRNPLLRTRPGQAGLGGDEQVVGVGVQGLGDDLLAGAGTVGVGGVDEVHPELDGPAQHGQALGAVGRLTPDARPRDAHGPEAEPADRPAGDLERPGLGGADSALGHENSLTGYANWALPCLQPAAAGRASRLRG